MTTFIYALKEPDTGEIRYIGKSNDPKKRLRGHKIDGEKNHRVSWIKSLLNRGLKPALEIVDEVPTEFWPQLEIAYIEFFREQGCRLVNSTMGGEGGADPSKETREKMRMAQLGNNNASGHQPSEEAKKKMAAPHIGSKHSLEHCIKKRDALKGRERPSFSSEWKKNLSVAAKLRRERERQEFYLAEMWGSRD